MLNKRKIWLRSTNHKVWLRLVPWFTFDLAQTCPLESFP